MDSKAWILAVDIGNTHITLGAFLAENKSFPPVPLVTWRLSTHRHATADEYGLNILGLASHAGLTLEHLAGVVVASVVPPLDNVFRELSQKHLKNSALFVDSGLDLGVKILYDNPHEVGADRVINALAAWTRLGRDCIVVDFGTATTFDCVDGTGAYLGGAIAPGPQTASEALYQKTARLPLLGSFRKPSKAIGKNTQNSIASGLFHGYVGLTRGLIKTLSLEMGGTPHVLATGGLASLLAPSVPEIEAVAPDLTLEGLWLLWHRRFGEKNNTPPDIS